MSTQTVERLLVERCIAERGHRRVRFPAPVEQAYEGYSRRYRARLIASTILPSLLLYNLLLVADFLLLPQTFLLAAFCHLALVTPLLLFVGFTIRGEPRLWLRETLAMSVPLAMAAQILFIYSININHPAAQHYQYLVLLTVIYANVSQRLDFRFALAATTMLVAGYLWVVLPSAEPFASKLVGMAAIVSIGYLTLSANFWMERDARYGFLRHLRDRLQREDAELAANRDALTGLSNRYQLEKRIDELYGAGVENVHELSVGALMVDVDHFKAFNDHYGHPAGDTCLKRIAGAIAAQLRNENDLAIRYGGEEFLILLYDADLADAVRIAERLRRAIEGFRIPHVRASDHDDVTVSVGAMAGHLARYRISELVDGADAALYIAKRNGRNRVFPPLLADSRSLVLKPHA
ncbi:GGDEF domain-containing protein [Endozoicomonas sp. G2_2]|uniref:GGDEF domain-containing protein n=1 Tax=Endozoicomonas sp. G2_2 TaxID=2821092 RepID=UPI001ADAA052|nr:diguanylate cyclase [Endozoicomonas sp. G2_2]MBO9468698.1 GGDEF domain-containing protein [Endozoicomonas sp. G2_2]